MRAYSQLREFLCPRVFPVLPDAKSKTRQEEEGGHTKKYFGYLYTAKNQVLVLVFKYYMSRGE